MRVKTSSLLILFFIILSFPFLIKYVFVNHNQYEQIPLILRYLDSTYLSADWSLNLNSQFSPRIFFTIYMSLLSRILTLPVAYLLNFILNTALISLAIFLFVRRIYRSDLSALLTTIVILYGQKITLGGNDLIGRDFDPSRPAFALVVLAFVLLLEKKLILSLILFSLSAYLHPLIGIEAPAIFFIAYVFTFVKLRRHKKLAIEFKLSHIGKAALLYLVMTSLPIYSYIKLYLSQSQNGIAKDLLFVTIAKMAFPFHYSPLSWNITLYLKFFLLFALFLICFHKIKKKISIFDITLIKTIIFLIIFSCLIALVFTEIIPTYNVMILQFFRLTVILYWLFACIGYGGCFYWAFTKKKNLIKNILIGSVPIILSNIDFLLNRSFGSLIYLSLAIITAYLIPKSNSKIKKGVILILFLFIFALPYRHYRFSISNLYPFYTEETELAIWAKGNTPKEAIFLTPVNFIRFRLIANRPAIVDRLVIPFSQIGIYQWQERIRDVSGISNLSVAEINDILIDEGYLKLTMTQIQKLQQKYKFNYLIFPKNNNLPLSIVYVSKSYVIYKIRQNYIN